MKRITRTRREWIGKPQRCNPLPKAEEFFRMAAHIANRYGARLENCPMKDTERYSVALLGLAKALRKYRHKRTTKRTSTSTFIFRGIMNELATHKTISSADKRNSEKELLSLSNMGITEKGDYQVCDHREGHEDRLISDDHAELMAARIESVVPERWMKILKEQVCEGLTYTEVAKRYGIGRSRTQQIIENAKYRIRQAFPEMCR